MSFDNDSTPQAAFRSKQKKIHSGTFSNLFYSEIDPSSQQEPQRSTVLVSDFRGNLIDTCVAGLQEMHGAFNA